MTELAARVDDLRRDGVRLLAGTIVDNAGVLRTKCVPGAQLQAAVTRGVGHGRDAGTGHRAGLGADEPA